MTTRSVIPPIVTPPRVRPNLPQRSLGLAVVTLLLPTLLLPTLAIAAAPLLRPGDSGPPVQQLQLRLAEWGLDPGGVDGIYGAETAQAVRSLQQQQGLPVDGIAGPQTQQVLAQARPLQPLPSPSLVTLTFTPLVVAAPPPPPSALWLAFMPLVPITGGALMYLQQQIQRRLAAKRRPK